MVIGRRSAISSAAARFQELAALQRQHGGTFLEQHTRGEALVLANIRRHIAAEANSAAHLAGDDLGRHGNELPGVFVVADHDLGLHADGQVVGVGFRNLRVDFEAAQVDDGHHGRVPGYGGPLVDEQVADDSRDG